MLEYATKKLLFKLIRELLLFLGFKRWHCDRCGHGLRLLSCLGYIFHQSFSKCSPWWPFPLICYVTHARCSRQYPHLSGCLPNIRPSWWIEASWGVMIFIYISIGLFSSSRMSIRALAISEFK